MKTSKPLKWGAVSVGGLVLVFAGAQLVQPERADVKTDPEHTIQAQLPASSELNAIIDRACSECHSNTMSVRWYTQVAPFSWLIARSAEEGRRAVNFSQWTQYSKDEQRTFLLASCADARNGTMPMSAYLRFRPDAKLSARDVAIICGASL